MILELRSREARWSSADVEDPKTGRHVRLVVTVDARYGRLNDIAVEPVGGVL
jgi:hypothetical protein